MNTKTTFQLLLLFIIGYATGKHSSKIAESIETTASSTEVTEVSKQTEMALDVNNTSTEGHSDVHPLIDFNNTVTNQMVWNKMHQLQQLFHSSYFQEVIIPVMLGVVGALVTLALICSIRSCARTHARQRRKRRIRNLADELKTDRTMLLADSSDDEF